MISRFCSQGTHAWCEDTGCECPACHFVCDNCGKSCRSVSTFGDDVKGWCAPCAREYARTHPFRGTPCDKCGSKGAVRNPRGRKNEYLCTPCHQQSGVSFALPATTSGMLASCAHLPLTDREHEFMKVRGNRFRCRRCNQDFFGSPSSINVVGEVASWR